MQELLHLVEMIQQNCDLCLVIFENLSSLSSRLLLDEAEKVTKGEVGDCVCDAGAVCLDVPHKIVQVAGILFFPFESEVRLIVLES